ncbi:protein of unknown function [Nitrospina watsonii]|uniref:Uncharacterized protein n=1 Tax=Nitrospina watsonii TaxID=1323948 RepID=A0ABN8VV19_9BACT|nr:protein of unknown function [Nitrospina watsonii]
MVALLLGLGEGDQEKTGFLMSQIEALLHC